MMTTPGTELAVLGEWYQDHVSFNDMLGTILLGEAPSFSRVFPLILLFLRLSGIQVSFQGRTASPAVHVSASHQA